MNFGVLSHETRNLGDDIQSLAARRFLPVVSEFVPRDDIGRRQGPPLRMILNGWFMRGAAWPPPPSIDALLISFRIDPRIPSAYRRLLSAESIDYFRRNGPVGCRDMETMTLLQSYGVDAFFSGCLTLTLARPAVERSDQILFVDIPPAAERALLRSMPSDWAGRVRRLTHSTAQLAVSARLTEAERILSASAGASLVVTTRLHAALPCAAFDTPVFLIGEELGSGRFSGLASLVSHASLSDVFHGNTPDWISLSPGKKHLPLADALTDACRRFIGEGIRPNSGHPPTAIAKATRLVRREMAILHQIPRTFRETTLRLRYR